MQKNRNDREIFVEILKYKHDISIFTIRRIFKKKTIFIASNLHVN